MSVDVKPPPERRVPVDLGTLLAAVGLGLLALALFDLGSYWHFIASFRNW
ncbi:MAG: hypothetical protein H6713_29565 [Myxococcales bacterium]|nr:hypothetical protein [Myxococcales bacterium]